MIAFGLAEPALAAGALDQIQQQYQTASSGWMNAAIPYANHLFAGLAALEFSWAGVQFLLRKNDLPEFLTSVTLKVLSIGFFFTFLTMAPTWLPLIIASFTQAGSTISGIAAPWLQAGCSPWDPRSRDRSSLCWEAPPSACRRSAAIFSLPLVDLHQRDPRLHLWPAQFDDSKRADRFDTHREVTRTPFSMPVLGG
ncbi:MAG: hypothetical protein KGK17_01970 [Betaproteobacteria bacterium]|nr:hypothetical protein [Betaproteobacteria bacterium]